MQVYRKVSIPLRRYGVTLAKMDGTDPASSELKSRFKVDSFPTIKLLWWGQADERLSFAVSMIRGEEDLLVHCGSDDLLNHGLSHSQARTLTPHSQTHKPLT